MRKQILYSLLITCCLYLSGCAEDKGNYEYTNLNTVTIANISAMALTPGANIQITPELTRSQEAGEKDLSFQWEVDGKVLSNDRNLNALLPAMTYGQKECALIVTDKDSGMKYFKRFNINIVNEFNYGYYFLTRQQDKSTIVSYLPSYKEDDEVPHFLHTAVCGDVTFGKEPMKIAGNFGYINAVENYFWSMSIITKEGDYPVTLTNNGTFFPTSLISKDNFIDKDAGYEFSPEDYSTDPRQQENFISKGKLIFYSSGLLYRPAKHKGDYYWSIIRPFYTGENILWAFDELSRKFYVVHPQESNPSLGIVGDASALDQVTNITDSPVVEPDEKVIGLSKNTPEESTSMIAYIGSSEGIKIYKYGRDGYTYNFNFAGSTLLPIAGINEDSQLAALNKDCFFSIGNTIYTSPIDLPKLSEFISIPAEYGKIVKMGLSSKETRLIITTYNENSTEEKKGSVIFIDIQNKKIAETFKNSIEECVSILGANADMYGMTGGLGDDK